MTDQHPIIPPDELVLHVATKAADWQLERVIEWLNNNLGHSNYLGDSQ